MFEPKDESRGSWFRSRDGVSDGAGSSEPRIYSESTEALGCVREICHASRYQPKLFLLEILPRARYCAVREIFCLRETESRSGNISPNSCQTEFLLRPQTPPDCVTICDPACYLCDANVTQRAREL